MDSFYACVSSHPIIVMVIAAIVLLMIYFIFVKFFKMVLILGLILIACAGFFYCQSPEEFPDNVKKIVETAREKGDVVAEKGRDAIEDSRELIDGIGKMVERGKKAFSSD